MLGVVSLHSTELLGIHLELFNLGFELIIFSKDIFCPEGNLCRPILPESSARAWSAAPRRWTGDATVDADIDAYYEARKALG